MKVLMSFFLAGLLTAPAWAAATAVPGTVNYVEGQVTIGDQSLDSHSIGTATLQPGQEIVTDTGKAEVLLSPGVFLRMDNQSSAKMLAGSISDTEVKLEQGEAMVEVTEIHQENNLRITQNGVTTRLVKNGLYDFDAVQHQIRVFHGKAVVLDGDRDVKVDGGHMVDLNTSGNLKSRSFDRKDFEQSDLYRWSSLRSQYLAQANADAARSYVVNGVYGPGWVGGGWYWNPWFGTYTFIPADGIFYSPFGWGFYSPLVVFRSPFFFVGHPVVHAFRPGFPGPIFVPRPAISGRFRPAPAPIVREHPRMNSGFGSRVGGGSHVTNHFGGRH